MSCLAVDGGVKAVETFMEDRLFHWPVVTDEDLNAVNAVLKAGNMSGTNITKEFEKEYAAWNGTMYALGTCNGTAALTAAVWACGVGAGDEVIAPSLTYWATCASVLTFGGTVNFVDVDPETLCIDPKAIERSITDRTKAVIVVNYAAMPADWDAILALARKHGIKVIEDNSHAQGSVYKGRMCGSFGDIAGTSLMSGKSFAIGEAGIITTNDRTLYERCIAFAHYERTGLPSRFNPADPQITIEELKIFRGLPIGGVKHRMNQTCSAMGLVQLKHYPERIQEIQKAMNYFSDGLDSIPGLKVIRPDFGSSSCKGGWYFPLCHYDETVIGVSAERFAEALKAENIFCAPGANMPLHVHPYFHSADIFRQGRPTALAFGQRDVRRGEGALLVTEHVKTKIIQLPCFKKFDKKAINQYISGYRKVSEHIGKAEK